MIFTVSVERSAGLRRVTQQPAALVRRAGVLASKRAAEEYVDAIHEDIRARRPFTPRTGRLESSVGWHAKGRGAEVFVRAPYAGHVERGTRPHVIRPKAGRKALRFFMGGAGGGMVIARQVRHPGTAPHPFFFHDLPGRQVRILRQARLAVAEVMLGGSTA